MKYAIKKKIVDADTGIECDSYAVSEMSAEMFIKTIFTLGGKTSRKDKYRFAIRDIEIDNDMIVVQIDRDYRTVE